MTLILLTVLVVGLHGDMLIQIRKYPAIVALPIYGLAWQELAARVREERLSPRWAPALLAVVIVQSVVAHILLATTPIEA